jgi:hypothetical protein
MMAILSFKRTSFPPDVLKWPENKAKGEESQRQVSGSALEFAACGCHLCSENHISSEPSMAEPNRNQPVDDARPPAPGGIAARALEQRAAPYLAELNPEQRQAVECWPARAPEKRVSLQRG